MNKRGDHFKSNLDKKKKTFIPKHTVSYFVNGSCTVFISISINICALEKTTGMTPVDTLKFMRTFRMDDKTLQTMTATDDHDDVSHGTV